MATKFSEEQVHQHLYKQGLESLVDDAPEFDAGSVAKPIAATESAPSDEGEATYNEVEFELWRIIKAKGAGEARTAAPHNSIR